MMNITDFINCFSTPQKALESVLHTPAPNKMKRAKKLLCTLIRTYIYLIEQA